MQPVQHPFLALTFRIATAAALATLLMLVKYASEQSITLPEIMFWRQAMTPPMVLAWLWWTSGLYRLRTQRIGSHARRAGVGMFNMMFNFGAAILLPLAEATTLSFTTPLFAVLLGALIMREHVGPWRWTAVVLGFLGVLIIAQPGSAPISTLGATAGLIAGFLTAVINFQIRDLGRTEEPIRTVFWFGVFGTLLAALAQPFFATAHTAWEWFILVSIGVVGTLTQLLLATSLRYGSVSSVIAMDYTSLVWATLYGWLVWNHFPPLTTWLGAPLIVAAGLVIVWREHRLARGSLRSVSASGD